MTLSSRVENASATPARDGNPYRSGLFFRTIIFISLHVAFVGAGFLLYTG